jgi:hypothetical protein
VGAAIQPRRLLAVLPLVLLALTKLAAVGVAPQLEPEPALSERAPLANAYLVKRLAVWQKRLQLQGWKISIVLTPPAELRRGTLGNIHWDAPTSTAKIRVLDPAAYKTPYQVALKDMEFTVVHELIHLELASLPRSDASRSDEEHAVNNMTSALLELAE